LETEQHLFVPQLLVGLVTGCLIRRSKVGR